MINELRLIENINLLFEMKVILYGAGFQGLSVYGDLKCAGIPVNYFCDGNSQKWGQNIDRIVIISPEQLKKLDEQEEIVIIICTSQKLYAMQIFDNLENLQIKTKNVLTLIGLEILFIQNANNPRISGEYRDFLLQIGKMRKELVPYERNIRNIRHYQKRLNSCPNILMYSSPKVGSSTIDDSLHANGINCFHAHYYTSICEIPSEISNLTINMVKKLKNIKIITVVREPLGMSLSWAFQNMDDLGVYGIIASGNSFLDDCVKWMKEKTFELSSENSCYGFEFDWFDSELKTVFGIDVFGYPFDKEKGYAIINQGNVEVLLMKLEKLNSLEPIIGEFVGVPDFKIVNANESNDKIYKYLYKNVREDIKIPRDIVSLYYGNNPRMNHFYTDEEKAAFLKKWGKNIEQ